MRPGATSAGWLPLDPVVAAVLNVAVALLALFVTVVVAIAVRLRPRRGFTTAASP